MGSTPFFISKALFVHPDFGDPDAIDGYVQWGSTGHKREDPATRAGVWETESFVEAAGGSVMEASGPGARSAGAWTVS